MISPRDLSAKVRKLAASAVTLVRSRYRAYRVQHKNNLVCLELTDVEISKAATAHATKLRSGLVGFGMVSR